MTACVWCRGRVQPRYTADGYPRGSMALKLIDPKYLLCSLRCAARYGAEAANRTEAVTVDRMALINADGQRRKIAEKRRASR